ncbi:Dihydrofolate reductase [Chitinophaga sp. CF118]|uniref:dihydrofolate reductase family protein n=1 Tax=Chitinophaga sp. CF118 TaxID=1884367 RepID=UPI0008E6FFF8|nr:dihydrofolate reductase family protein [Chitinophaga sp. CF118]SFE96491.1 Dihydrofolate reductase [Chitinophaga sp. CF118]
MRKLKLQMQISVDGYVAGPNGEMDWMQWNWDEELNNYVIELTEPVDCILLGRKLAEGFIPAWAASIANPETEDAGGHKMVDTHKIVFSKTLKSIEGKNVVVENGDMVEAVTALKKQPGKDIIVYGGSTFVSSLIQQGLIDEYHLFVNPAAIGKGMSIFNTLQSRLNLKLVTAKPFECGIVVLYYKYDRQ